MSTRHEEAVLAELLALRELSKNFIKKYAKMMGYEAENQINKTLTIYSIAREVELQR